MKLKDIDILFDVQVDSGGKDPDSASNTLRTYHRLLWSKPLPNGQYMQLVEDKGCLRWNEMYFSSDSITASFLHYRFPLKDYVEQQIPNFSEFKKDYLHKTYTIGGSIIFPLMKWSMNQARGCNVKICDRWDLTLECIRRFYVGESSPLDKSLEKNHKFFELFVDFKGYVDFFLLQDCVDEHYSVKFWLNTPLFINMPMPQNMNEYYMWIKSQMDFVDKRGNRILQYINETNSKLTMDNNYSVNVSADDLKARKDSVKTAVKDLMDKKNISPLMNEIFNLILRDEMNRNALNAFLSQKGLSCNDIKSEMIAAILQYANMILEDGIITADEMRIITLLKIFLQINEDDFYKYNYKSEIKHVLDTQLDKIFEDSVVDKQEALKMNDLQSLFGLSYDEFESIVNEHE